MVWEGHARISNAEQFAAASLLRSCRADGPLDPGGGDHQKFVRIRSGGLPAGAGRFNIGDPVTSWYGCKINNTPMVKLAPLPCQGAVLECNESVFNGMSVAVIHNSDYKSVDAAKAAIDRYFAERNTYFKNYPKRAGNKIWGDELVPSKFSESNNCKNPKFMKLAAVR